MKRKKILFYMLMIISLVILLQRYTNHMIGKSEYGQKKYESKLPFSEHIERIENAVIRVVIKTNGFRQVVHPMIQISGSSGMVISSGEEKQECQTNEIVQISADDLRFQKGPIYISSKQGGKLSVHSLKRGYGVPSYEGNIEVFSTAEGIVIVNEIPLEKYLYAVVPSEMPASYELEALKCQAVCARSYAYCHIQTMAYPEYRAHVDDSTAYQVYGNSKTQESTKRAVDETKGKVLTYKDNIIKTYYFSTSCGLTTSIEAWGSSMNESNRYLCGINVSNGIEDYEKDLPWYRWKASVKEVRLSELIELNTGTEIGELKNIEITKQGHGGIAQQLVITGTKNQIVIETENKIRKVLGGEGYHIEKQDGTIIESSSLLPSAFFTICKKDGQYIIEGGGHGHGIGMSQNGANEMAKKGRNYEEILEFFYPGTKVK